MDKNTLEVTIWKLSVKATGMAAVIVLALCLLVLAGAVAMAGHDNILAWSKLWS
jgi:hypothetical protein